MARLSVRQAINNAAAKINEAQSEADAKTLRAIYKRYLPIEKRVYTRIFNDIITTFYNSYDPTRYSRQGNVGSKKGGLYNVLDIERARRKQSDSFGTYTIGVDDDDGYSMINPEEMTIQKYGAGKYNAPEEIFHTVFEMGFHGGARKISAQKAKKWGQHPQPGVPFYRRRGFVTADNGKKINHRWGRWFPATSPAKSSLSPKSQFIKETEDLGDVGGELYEKLSTIAHEENAKTQKILVPKLREIFIRETVQALKKGGD